MAYTGDGSNDYIQASATISGSYSTAYTWHLWYKPTAVPANTTPVRIPFCVAGTSPGLLESYLSWQHTDAAKWGGVVHGDTGNGYVRAAFGSTPAADTWHAIGGNFDGTTLRAYLNGSESGSATGAITNGAALVTALAYSMALGAASDYATGDVAEAALWAGVSLSAAEHAALAKGFCPSLIRPASLVFYAPLMREAVARKGPTITVSGATVAAHPKQIYRAPPFLWQGDRSVYVRWATSFNLSHGNTVPPELAHTLTLTDAWQVKDVYETLSQGLHVDSAFSPQHDYLDTGRMGQ